jgi:N-acetylglucosaminyldiphosphoundecaprenol N-acetyl-beta-D-mannosaminyltransferase
MRLPDDFDRPVYCLAGLPFDAVDMAGALERVRRAAATGEPCFLSTPNLNFLIGCQGDGAFRDSVIHSDLSVADGMPLVWMARLLGIPIHERVAGSGLFEALWRGGQGHDAVDQTGAERLPVYFFGGPDGVAERACRTLNAHPSGLRCAGFECPGFGGVEDMSDAATIDRINASGARFLVVALGARKGQAWIERNRGRIEAPVISHLGAVVNFVAGTVSRAPVWMQRIGLEWLWRIKEEPQLWRRYGLDGLAFMRLWFARVLPYALWLRLRGQPAMATGDGVLGEEGGGHWRVAVAGVVPDAVPAQARQALREAAAARREVVVDMSAAKWVGPGFMGLLLMLKKHQDERGLPLRVTGADGAMRRLFRWNGVGYLLRE